MQHTELEQKEPTELHIVTPLPARQNGDAAGAPDSKLISRRVNRSIPKNSTEGFWGRTKSTFRVESDDSPEITQLGSAIASPRLKDD